MGQQAAGTATYSLDAFGPIVSSVTTGSPSRTQSFRYDAAGQGIENYGDRITVTPYLTPNPSRLKLSAGTANTLSPP
jgi:hypothetical protein